jgi:hypothetical protein
MRQASALPTNLSTNFRGAGNKRRSEAFDRDESRPENHPEPSVPSNAEKDPDNWTTGAESMTGAHLKTLCEEAGEAFDETLTKAEASKMIDALQSKTGRGRNH